MGKMKRILSVMAIILIFATTVRANYYIAENTVNNGETNSGSEEKVIVIPRTSQPDESMQQPLEQGNDATNNADKEKQAVDTGTMQAAPNEDISTEAKFESYENYENAALAKKSSSATFRMAQLYFRDGLYEKAVNLALKDQAPDIPLMYVIAIGSRLMGNNERSIDYYSRILSEDGNQAEAKLGIGIAYKSKGDFSKALGYLRDYNSTHSNEEVKKEIAILNEILASSR